MKQRRFSRRDLRAFKELLLKYRAQLAGTIEHFKDDALNAIARRDGDLSTLPSESAEIGTQTFEQDLALSFMENEADTIGKIDYAIEQIAAGRYGVCDECGSPIPKARLKALPFATLCISCREHEERERLS